MFHSEKEEVVLGVDPGTLITGYGLVRNQGSRFVAEDFGCIRPPRKLPLTQRYHVIYKGVQALLKKFNPQAVSVETQYVHLNVQAAMKLGMARGVILLAATDYGIPVFEYAPTKAKLAVVGKGRASKQQVQSMVQTLLSLSSLPQPEDAADALALAICHHQAKANLDKFAGQQI